MLQATHLTKTYAARGGKPKVAVNDLSFEVAAGEFVCIVGPSGCGKTTLLKCLSGLIRPTSGELLFEGQVIDGPPKTMALVFQEYTRSLLPWLTVEKNVSLPLPDKGLSRADAKQAALQALRDVGLPDVASAYPWQLSGGMQQRVAIARALAYRPHIMLMDEPFASVDAQTRSDLEDLMHNLHGRDPLTTLFVTHDIDEAVYLADRVIVLSGSPARVADVVEVDLPKPRNQITTKQDRRFVEMRTRILREIHAGSRSQTDPSGETYGPAGTALASTASITSP